MRKVDIDELTFVNKNFWHSFFLSSYPNAYHEQEDNHLLDLAEEIAIEEDLEYWNQLTGWYGGMLDERDGYIDKPSYLEIGMGENNDLRIEFYPGDILYFINGEEIGNTGSHWKLNVLPFDKIKSVLETEKGEILFWLLLPLAKIEEEEMENTCHFLTIKIKEIFEEEMGEMIVRLIIYQFLE